MRRLTSILDRPLLVVLIVAAAYGIFFVRLLERRGNDVSRFVIAGGSNVDPAAVPRGLTVIPGIGGYDGLAFYRLALDPFTTQETDFGIKLDNPAYRHQRIVYPLIVYLLSFGRAELVPMLLAAVNLAALAAIGWLGALFARQYGRHALWGCAFAFYPGFLITLSRDTAEIVAVAFGLAAMVALSRGRHIAAAALLTAALLSRETMLLLAVGICAAWLFARVRDRVSSIVPYTFLVPIALFTLWQLLLGRVWGTLPVLAGSPGFSLPFAEFFRFLGQELPRRTEMQRVHVNECAFLLILVAVAAAAMFSRKGAPSPWRFTWVATIALASTVSSAIWVEHYAFMRVFADLHLTSIAVTLPDGRGKLATILLAACGVWWHLGEHLVLVG